jgi:hypothetical protein
MPPCPGTRAARALPPHAQGFLSQFSGALLSQLGFQVPPETITASVTQVLRGPNAIAALDTTISRDAAVLGGCLGVATAPAPTELRVDFKHVCRFTGCILEDCALCRNNPSKMCGDADCLDQQYWVRDDGKGGQSLRGRCGAEVALQLFPRGAGIGCAAVPPPPGVRLKLYVISGGVSAPQLNEELPALYLSDDGNPLYCSSGVIDDDGGAVLEFEQVCALALRVCESSACLRWPQCCMRGAGGGHIATSASPTHHTLACPTSCNKHVRDRSRGSLLCCVSCVLPAAVVCCSSRVVLT